MKITLKLERNVDMGLENAEDRFYLVFEKHIPHDEIVALFNREGFQSPEIVQKDGTLQVFINKRIPDPFLDRAAIEAGTPLLEDYSIFQALKTIMNNVIDFELDENAIKTLHQSYQLANEQKDNLLKQFGPVLEEAYMSPFILANVDLDEEFIEGLQVFAGSKHMSPGLMLSDISEEEISDEKEISIHEVASTEKPNLKKQKTATITDPN